MNRPVDERVHQLERSLKRRRLIGLGLIFLLICALVIGGLITTIPATQEPGHFWDFLPWVRARRAEEEARRQTLDALREAEAVRQQLEAKRAQQP